MRLMVTADVRARRGGTEAQAIEVGLCGHGSNDETAVTSLRRVVEAWAHGLHHIGELQRAAASHRITVNDTPDSRLVVEVRVRNISDGESAM